MIDNLYNSVLELYNAGHLVSQMYFCDAFLNGQFFNYGIEMFKYYKVTCFSIYLLDQINIFSQSIHDFVF